jgi:tetratricopeptide (TPR) repeat protein
MMVTEKDELASARRKLILRDSLGFLTLLVVTLVLSGFTLLLFRSFSAHREDLAQRWSQRGEEALKAGKPDQAIVALRTALSYAPDTRSYELLLAQALGDAGLKEPNRTEESYSRFMSLWERQPGDGFINLQLARLAARRGDRTAAIEFYRASIYGTWQGDGVLRRSHVRLELARYLIASGEYPAARMELLIAAGNVPDTPEFDRTLGDLLVEAQDAADAANFYQKALTAAPRDPGLLQAAGELAYRAGESESAHRLLARAETARAEQHLPPEDALAQKAKDAGRIAEIAPLPSLSVHARGERVLAARRLAKKRLDACVAGLSTGGGPQGTALQPLQALWAGPNGTVDGAALRNDPDLQDATMRLVYNTEIATQKVCAPAAGDDAFLLLLAGRATDSPAQGTPPVAASAAVAEKRQ